MNFKSIKWKISLMFALCIATILSLLCAYQTFSVIYKEKQDFKNTINSVFSEEYIKNLYTISETVDYTVDQDVVGNLTLSTLERDNARVLFDTVSEYNAQLEIDRSRYMCILDKDGVPLYSTHPDVLNEGVTKTASVIAAINGNAAMSTPVLRKQNDYAVALSDSSHIVYICDTGDEMYGKAKDVLWTYLYSMIFSLLFSLVAGIYLAGSVTVPIKRMSDWAKQLAKGDLNAKADIPGNDELSELSKSLADMADNLDMASEEVRSEKTKLETILQAMTDGLLAFNTEGELIHYNEEAKRLLGRNYLDDIIFDNFFKEINASITIGDLLYMKPTDEDMERQVVIDKERYIDMNFKTFNLNDKIAGIVVVLHDMTKQEKLEQSRRGFVADVSHELRTPITTIKSYAETLLDTSEDYGDLFRRFIGVIASEADRMARLISDLLTLSSLDDKHSSYKIPVEIDVRTMLMSVVERFQISSKKKEQTLEYNPINDVPLLMGDPDSLERVIINIIGNAVKYTPEKGRIEVYSSKVYNDVCIKVIDNGIGISAEGLPHIFDRFYRVDKARSRDTGGTGLGLAIAKQIIETEFKGKIKITSEVGKGTEVSITIPVSTN